MLRCQSLEIKHKHDWTQAGGLWSTSLTGGDQVAVVQRRKQRLRQAQQRDGCVLGVLIQWCHLHSYTAAQDLAWCTEGKAVT